MSSPPASLRHGRGWQANEPIGDTREPVLVTGLCGANVSLLLFVGDPDGRQLELTACSESSAPRRTSIGLHILRSPLTCDIMSFAYGAPSLIRLIDFCVMDFSCPSGS